MSHFVSRVAIVVGLLVGTGLSGARGEDTFDPTTKAKPPINAAGPATAGGTMPYISTQGTKKTDPKVAAPQPQNQTQPQTPPVATTESNPAPVKRLLDPKEIQTSRPQIAAPQPQPATPSIQTIEPKPTEPATVANPVPATTDPAKPPVAVEVKKPQEPATVEQPAPKVTKPVKQAEKPTKKKTVARSTPSRRDSEDYPGDRPVRDREFYRNDRYAGYETDDPIPPRRIGRNTYRAYADDGIEMQRRERPVVSGCRTYIVPGFLIYRREVRCY